MAIVRLTTFMRDDDGHGFSEQHDVDGGPEPVALSAILNAFDAFNIKFRRPMLAGDCFYLGCRASYKTSSGRIAASNIIKDPPVQGTQTVQGESVFVNDTAVAVKARIQNAASTSNTDIYLRGVFDQVFVGGVLNFNDSNASKAWKSMFDAYLAGLISSRYGYSGIDQATTSRGNITNYVIGLDGRITFTFASTNLVNPAIGNARRQIIFSRLNDSNSVLNRALVCTVPTNDTFVTVSPIAANDFSGMGTYIAPVRAFIPYAQLGYLKLARRKTGRVFGVGSGRLPARKRG